MRRQIGRIKDLVKRIEEKYSTLKADKVLIFGVGYILDYLTNPEFGELLYTTYDLKLRLDTFELFIRCD